MAATDYSTVTELAGDDSSREQVEQMCHRSRWVATYCDGNDVIEATWRTGDITGAFRRQVGHDTEQMFTRCLMLPMNASLSDDDLAYMCVPLFVNAIHEGWCD